MARFSVGLTLGLRAALASSPVGIRYSDWDGAETCRPLSLSLPASEEAVVALVADAAANGDQVLTTNSPRRKAPRFPVDFR